MHMQRDKLDITYWIGECSCRNIRYRRAEKNLYLFLYVVVAKLVEVIITKEQNIIIAYDLLA